MLVKDELITLKRSNQNLYYQGKGYDVSTPTYQVRAEDLNPKSAKIITYLCDDCGIALKIPMYRYTNGNHDGKYYCYTCGIKRFTTGSANLRWDPTKSEEERIEQRRYPEYTAFVKRVMARDNYTCQCCKKEINHDGEVHHLDGYEWAKDKRTDDKNGITLCKICHKNFHSIYGYGNNTKAQFEEWMKDIPFKLEEYNGELPTTKKIYCVEDDKIYDSAMQCAEINGGTEYSYYAACLNKIRFHGKTYLYYDEYLGMTKKEKNTFINRKLPTYHEDKRVILLNTLEIFDSIGDAEKKTGVNNALIAQNAVGRSKVLQTKIDGIPMIFMYYQDYEKLPDKNINRLTEWKADNGYLCKTTGKVYFNTQDAANDVGIKNRSCITRHLSHPTELKSAGKHPNFPDIPLTWMRYKDFLSLSEDQQLNIAKSNKEFLLPNSLLFNILNNNK